MPALPLTPKERPVYTIADQMAAKLYIDATLVAQTSGTSDQVIERCLFSFPSLWEGLGEGAKLDADRPSPQPSPKGRGSTDSDCSDTMSATEPRPLNIICFATFFKGGDFMRECRARGCNFILITKEKMLHEDWPRDVIEEIFAVPNDAPVELFLDLVSHIAKTRRPDRIVALEEFDVVIAALAREHLCLPGMSSSTAKTFRDKLAMSVRARDAGIILPDFVPAVNNEEIKEYLDRIPAPWVLKPRSDVSAIGIRKLESAAEAWSAIEELNQREILRERASYHLIARFVPGEVFHVDSLVDKRRVVFAGVNKYGCPPLQVAHGGGAYISQTIAHDSPEKKKLLEINRRLIKAMNLDSGATHAEFIKSEADGEFYFLEIAARVGGAYIADVLEAASGINLWREWARLEIDAT